MFIATRCRARTWRFALAFYCFGRSLAELERNPPPCIKYARIRQSRRFSVESSLCQRILDALSVDPLADEQCRISATATATVTANSPWSWENGLLLYKNLVYIPQDDAIRLE